MVMAWRLVILDRLPHSDIHGYNGYWHLTVTFRSQSRPSSILLTQGILFWLLKNLFF